MADCVLAQENCTGTLIGVNNASACTNCTSQWNYTTWQNQDPCNYSDVILQNRTKYDLCGNWSNVTETREIACNYCDYSESCTAWGSCVNSTQNKTCYDSNYASCCGLSALLSGDCYRQDNFTYTGNYTLNQSCSVSNGSCLTVTEMREENSKMMIVLIPIFIAGMLLWIGQTLQSDDHVPLKLFLQLTALVFGIISFWLGSVAIGGTNAELIEAAADVTWIVGILAGLIVMYWILLFIKSSTITAMKNKEEKTTY